MSKQFYSFVKNEAGDSELILDGVIASESWFDDEISPAAFREELDKHTGNITVRINSPGGDVFAGVSIMNMLKDREGDVTIIVDGLAASIASVIAMAGDKIIMNSGSMMMIHNAWTLAAGDSQELRKVADQLDKIGESIISVYADRTGLGKDELKDLLAAETWMTAEEAVEYGFADEAVEGKTRLSNAVKNVLRLTQDVQNAVMQPAMSLKTKLKNETEEVEETDVTDTTETTDEVTTEEPATADDAAETETETVEEVDEPEATEVVEPVVEVTNKSTKETQMSKQDEIATTQVIEPSAQAPVAVAPETKMKDYLKSNASMEAFARILEANAVAGSAKDLAGNDASQGVRAAWKEHLETKMGVTNPEVFLPTPLIQEIEDAFKAGGEIWNRVSKTGMDSFNAAWDAETDVDEESSRAKGYNRADEEEKAEQSLTFANRILRPQFVYKYITLNREDVKEQRETGALVRFVLSELPKRIIREIERAIVTGDGRAAGSDYKIQEGTPRGFYPVAADAAAGNVFASTYVPVAGHTVYETLRRARALIKAEGQVVLVAKEGLLLDMEFEQNANGGFLFAPGSDLARYIKVDAVVEPDWMDNDDNDAYMFVADKYRVVGDQSVEAFQNFILKTNKNEYLQEIWAGGGLTAGKSGVAIASGAAS